MKKVVIICLGIQTFSMISCVSKQVNINNETNQVKMTAVNGTITGIEDGKDGYTAAITDANGKKYLATISIVNLQKSGGNYKRYEIGDSISVKGSFWNDNGTTHITVSELSGTEARISVTGKITQIENGRDGYTATIVDANGKIYVATISVIDLQKNSENYKLHRVGETISVSGI